MHPLITVPLALALGGLLLAGCGGSGQPVAAPTTTPSQAPASPSPVPSPVASPVPRPSADPRSPTALAGLVRFSSDVTATTPAQRDALRDYEDYVRTFVVAEGLGEPRYAPLLARMGPKLEPVVVKQLQDRADDGEYALGPYVDRVLALGKGPQTIALVTCTDVTGRDTYDATTDKLKPDTGGSPLTTLKLNVTMQITAQGYEVADVTVPADSSC